MLKVLTEEEIAEGIAAEKALEPVDLVLEYSFINEEGDLVTHRARLYPDRFQQALALKNSEGAWFETREEIKELKPRQRIPTIWEGIERDVSKEFGVNIVIKLSIEDMELTVHVMEASVDFSVKHAPNSTEKLLSIGDFVKAEAKRMLGVDFKVKLTLTNRV